MKNRILSLVIILTLLTYVLINVVINFDIYAVQYSETYSQSNVAGYTGYQELIDALKEKHPTWNFTIYYTGLDWNTVIRNETTEKHGRNVVPASRTSAWKCEECGDTPRGGSSWRCASVAAVSYYMDPRNWINDDYIFQFETLSFNADIQNIEGVEQIISNIGYMKGDTITYTATDGSKKTINKSYAQVILEAASEANISPYHLAARLKQEQGAGSTPGSTATGTYSGYNGYYNFMNIGATGDTDSEVIVNGLESAKSNGWTDPEKSIKGGAKSLVASYINRGQDTLYFQKFDVDNRDGSLYYHQYMQNVSACVTEGSSVRNTYEQLGLLGSSIDFKIPVYENMPQLPCEEPREVSVVTQNVQIKGTSVRIRKGTSTSADIITTEDNGYNLLRIEIAQIAISGIYWDKVVLSDGRQGYVSHQYLTQVDDITNCNETVVLTGTGVYLRNGPGINGTKVIGTLNKGDLVTRIEKDKYSVDGYNWDRVVLSNGTQGYIAQKYLMLPITAENSMKLEEENLICIPTTTVELVKEKYPEAIITNANDEAVESGNVGTGYKIQISEQEYTIIKLGDVNGDGKTSSMDYALIKNHIMDIKEITDVNQKLASDVNSDGKTSSMDYALIKNHIMDVKKITLD